MCSNIRSRVKSFKTGAAFWMNIQAEFAENKKDIGGSLIRSESVTETLLPKMGQTRKCADVTAKVRSTPNNGHQRTGSACRTSASNGHGPASGRWLKLFSKR